jgi:hypothetical protein
MWIRKMLLGFLFMLMSIGLHTLVSGILQLFHIQANHYMTVFAAAFIGFFAGIFSNIDKYYHKSP